MSDRPKIKIQLSQIDIFAEIIAAAVIVFNIVLIAYSWVRLPERIPIHFNAAGEIDGYGGKGSFLILFILSILFYIGLTILSKFPHKYNYLVNITD